MKKGKKGRINIESKAKRSFGVVKIYTHTNRNRYMSKEKKSPVTPRPARKPG